MQTAASSTSLFTNRAVLETASLCRDLSERTEGRATVSSRTDASIMTDAAAMLEQFADVLGAAEAKTEDAGITSRERQVLTLIARGKTTKEVAVALGIEIKTADTHRTNVQAKLEAHGIADMTRAAIRFGLVRP